MPCSKFDTLVHNFISSVHEYCLYTVIHQQENLIFREKETQEIHRLFPKAEMVEIEGAGHWIHSEKPAEFLNTVTEFLDRS